MLDAELPPAAMVADDGRSRDLQDGSEVARQRDAPGNPAGFGSDGSLSDDHEVVTEQSPAGRDRGKREGRFAMAGRAENDVGVSVVGDEPRCVQHVAVLMGEQVGHGEVKQLLPRMVEIVAVSADPCGVSCHPGSGRRIVEVHDELIFVMPHAGAHVDVAGPPTRLGRPPPLVPNDESGWSRLWGETLQEPRDRRGAILIGGEEDGGNVADVDDTTEGLYHRA